MARFHWLHVSNSPDRVHLAATKDSMHRKAVINTADSSRRYSSDSSDLESIGQAKASNGEILGS